MILENNRNKKRTKLKIRIVLFVLEIKSINNDYYYLFDFR